MRDVFSDADQLQGAKLVLRPRGAAVFGAGLLFAAAAILAPNPLIKIIFLLVVVVLALATLALRFGPDLLKRIEMAQVRRIWAVPGDDPAPVVLTRPDGRIKMANGAAQKVLGAYRGQGLRDALQAVLTDPAAALDAFDQHRQAARAHQIKFQRLSGQVVVTRIPVKGRFEAWRIEDHAGTPAWEDWPVATLSLDRDDLVLHANPAARALLGSNADMVPLFAVRPPLTYGDFNMIKTASGLLRCFVQEQPNLAGGREVMLFPAADQAGDVLDGWSFFDALPVPLLKLSDDGVIELSNRYARELLGVESGAGRNLAELLEGPGRPVGDWVRDAADGRGTVQAETLKLRRLDREAFVQVVLNPASDAGKTVLIAVMQDATKLKSLELQFVQSQKMQAIGQLAGGVAHDFNNLLTAISGHCDLLLLRHDMEDPDYPDLMQINQNANRAAALVGQLLAFSRKQTLRPQVMDMREMLADLTHLLNRLVGETVQLTLHHDPDLWAVRADKRQLEQVLMNLVVNARDAMPGGGAIEVRTENVSLAAPLKRDRAVIAPGRYVVLHVSDQGMGIAPDKMQKVFEPFYTTKKQGEGTGLGLSTAYGIVKQTGGFIFVDSAPGEGTQFTLYLPAHDKVAKCDVAAPEVREPISRSGGVVLLVEDEAPVRAFASRALKMRGLSVVEAASAEEALETLQDDALHVDVIVTDVVMPGKDGPTWVREALANRPGTRVVFVSGYASDSLRNLEQKVENAVFLPKPFSLTELTEVVQKQLIAGDP